MIRLRDLSVWLSVALVLVTVAGLVAPLVLPPSVRVSQPPLVLTPRVVAGANVQVEFALCVSWPWPPRRVGFANLLATDLAFVRRLLEINAVVGLVPPCRIVKPAFQIPPETPAGRYTVREDWIVTDPLGPWREWRSVAIVLQSQPFEVVREAPPGRPGGE